MKSPLDGLKVLELARVLAGPWAGQLLADLGAEVIKVESPIGDETRKWGEDSLNNNSSYFKCTNRGKSSFVANFKKKNELEMVQHLAKNADIIIENYKVLNENIKKEVILTNNDSIVVENSEKDVSKEKKQKDINNDLESKTKSNERDCSRCNWLEQRPD